MSGPTDTIASKATNEGTVDELAKYMTSLIVNWLLFEKKNDIFEYSLLMMLRSLLTAHHVHHRSFTYCLTFLPHEHEISDV